MISRIITGVFLLACWSLGSSNPQPLFVSEADIIVMEATNDLLPSRTLSQTVEQDLKAIRAGFPVVADILHIPKWQHGKLMFSNVRKETLDKIHESGYGPISCHPVLGNYTLVYFERPYNAPKLAKRLEEEFQIERVSFNQVIGRTSAIALIGEAFGNRKYVFYKGDYCTPTCKHRHYITFAVNPEENSVQLLDYEGVSILSQCGLNRKISMNGYIVLVENRKPSPKSNTISTLLPSLEVLQMCLAILFFPY